jgi:hypothetical protein
MGNPHDWLTRRGSIDVESETDSLDSKRSSSRIPEVDAGEGGQNVAKIGLKP